MGWRDVNWDWALFGFRGRLNRKPYWIAYLAIHLLLGCAYAGASTDFDWATGTAAVLMMLSAWVMLAIMAKRLHDRDKSAWWLLIFVFIPMTIDDFGPMFWLVSVPIYVWSFIELGFMRGTVGPNRWGPDRVNHA